MDIILVQKNLEKIKGVSEKDLKSQIKKAFKGYKEHGVSKVGICSPAQNGLFKPCEGEHYAHIEHPDATEVIFILKKDDETELFDVTNTSLF